MHTHTCMHMHTLVHKPHTERSRKQVPTCIPIHTLIHMHAYKCSQTGRHRNAHHTTEASVGGSTTLRSHSISCRQPPKLSNA